LLLVRIALDVNTEKPSARFAGATMAAGFAAMSCSVKSALSTNISEDVPHLSTGSIRVMSTSGLPSLCRAAAVCR